MRIEIDIRNDIDVETALMAVTKVVHNGKISKGEKDKMYYCWATSFNTDFGFGDKIIVATRQYRKNDCFVVYKEGKYNER